MKEFELLLENFWLVKEKDIDLYNAVKDASAKFRDFLHDKLGYRLIVNPYLIKLEKLPGKAETWMGIRAFDSKNEYGMFCLLLAFLEERGPGDQFVLSQITEYIQSTWVGVEKLDWTLYTHRRWLVKVLRYTKDMYLLSVNDGDDGKFMDSNDSEVLYESTGISRYFMRNFITNIINYKKWEDIESGEWLEADKDRGRVRRNRVYRRLIMSPVVYSEGSEDADYAYIKNYRNLIQKDFEDALGTALHVHKNGAFLISDASSYNKDCFPNNSTISDIVLQINFEIVTLLKTGVLQKRNDDIIITSKTKFEDIIETCRTKHLQGWSKEYREMGVEGLIGAVFEFMEDFNMIKPVNSGREIHLLPMCGKIIGAYPESFKNGERE